MWRHARAVMCCTLLSACAASARPALTAAPTSQQPQAPPTEPPASSAEPVSTSAATAATVTTAPRAIVYVFPFTGAKVSYGRKHSGYPATDVFGCGATVVAPIGGTIVQTREYDPWVPSINDPATRGGKYVSMIGDDGVRYYFAHLASVAVRAGDDIAAGTVLGVMGQTGDARATVCHTHVGISWPCPTDEWAVRRGEVWPWRYLDAWRKGEQLSPLDEVTAGRAKHADACTTAADSRSAADA